MDIKKRYVVYEMNMVMGSDSHLALNEVKFTGMIHNSFETEDDAIAELIAHEMKYEDFLILKNVRIY